MLRFLYLILWFLLVCAGTASAQPKHTEVTLISPWPAGGSIDVTTRYLAQYLEQKGYKAFVENRPGLNGAVGAGYAVQNKTNTILVDQISTYLNQTLYSNIIGSETYSNLLPVANLAQQYSVFCVHPSVMLNSFNQFLKASKANPLKFSFGNGGPGSPSWLTMRTLDKFAGVRLFDISYKTSKDISLALAIGEIDISSTNVTIALPLIKTKKIKPIATSWQNSPVPELQKLPNPKSYINELDDILNIAAFVSAKNQKLPVKQLQQDISDIVTSNEFKHKMSITGNDAQFLSEQDLMALIKYKLGIWNQVVK
jgi:tripartite-type tricarboxylate transporter receptor subunit TctC